MAFARKPLFVQHLWKTTLSSFLLHVLLEETLQTVLSSPYKADPTAPSTLHWLLHLGFSRDRGPESGHLCAGTPWHTGGLRKAAKPFAHPRDDPVFGHADCIHVCSRRLSIPWPPTHVLQTTLLPRATALPGRCYAAPWG